MKRIIIAGALALVGAASTAQAATWKFDDAAYVTCREAHAMQPKARIELAMFLAEHAAKRHGVAIPEDARGGELGVLVRGGCTLAPDAYLFTVIDRAIIADESNLPKR
ncbi:MAG: hypothetical protein JSR90_13530 [Proteobacteria bacterium]|nr:hypothetical protein [Pseudomonadota bacterium]